MQGPCRQRYPCTWVGRLITPTPTTVRATVCLLLATAWVMVDGRAARRGVGLI